MVKDFVQEGVLILVPCICSPDHVVAVDISLQVKVTYQTDMKSMFKLLLKNEVIEHSEEEKALKMFHF